MGWMRSMGGSIQVELTSADIPASLALIYSAGIPVFDVRRTDEVTVRLSVNRRQFDRLKQITQRRGEPIRVLRRDGMYYTFRSGLQRPVLVIGMLILLVLMICIPGRVFFVRVEGNTTVPNLQILEAAERCGIRFGAFRREVRSERVKNALLESLEQLQWAGVNTCGCVAVISVQEREMSETSEIMEYASGIVAGMDGIITSCTATKGNLLCTPGQAVKEGQLLISGYTDCGLKIRATSADGEIFAQTIRTLQAKIPLLSVLRGNEQASDRNFSLLIGKKRINLWKDSGIWDSSCGRIYSEYYITLPGSFTLPIGIAVEQYMFADLTEDTLSPEDAEVVLKDTLTTYLKNQMVAGTVQSSREFLSAEEGCATLAGEYVCTEMIGRVQREQIGE